MDAKSNLNNPPNLDVERLPSADSIPLNLYKYRSIIGQTREYTRRLLTQREIYLPTSAELNDPFDCAPGCRTRATEKRKIDFMMALTNKMLPRAGRKERLAALRTMKANVARRGMDHFLQAAVSSTLSGVGIFSLSARPDHPLMWSHYADSHRGICVRFRWAGLSELGLSPVNVEYSQVRPIVDPILDEPGLTLRSTLLTKADVWSYEQEWRSIGRDTSGRVQLPQGVVTGVILGALISVEDRAEVLKWVAESKSAIEVQEAKIDRWRYEITVQQVVV
jgi:hypothetical protein